MDRTGHDFFHPFSSLVTGHHYLTVSWQLWRCSRACQTGPGERWPGAAGGHKGDDGGAGQDDGRQRQRSEEKNCLYHPISRDLSKRYLSRASSERASSSRASDHSAVHVAPIGRGAARRAVYSPAAQIFFFPEWRAERRSNWRSQLQSLDRGLPCRRASARVDGKRCRVGWGGTDAAWPCVDCSLGRSVQNARASEEQMFFIIKHSAKVNRKNLKLGVFK